MKNTNKQKGYKFTEKGKQVYSKKIQARNGVEKKIRLNLYRDNAHRIAAIHHSSKTQIAPDTTEQIFHYISEGNPNVDLIKKEIENLQTDPQAQNPALQSTTMDSSESIFEEKGSLVSKIHWEYPYGDQQLIQEIQEAIEKEPSLSAVADFIQVSAENGIVTLEGTVNTEKEKMSAGDKAAAVAGFGVTHNYLQVTSIPYK